MNIVLEYIGRGAALPHVPARDLTETDFAERAELWEQESVTKEKLVSSGLYQYAAETTNVKYSEGNEVPWVNVTLKPKGKKKDGE